MKVISYNVNGLRSAITKGFVEWLSTNPADVICLQEIKAHKENVDFASIEALGYETSGTLRRKRGIAVSLFLPGGNPTLCNMEMVLCRAMRKEE